MKKTILKTVVATAVVAATMVISSVATFAAVFTDAAGTTQWDGSESIVLNADGVKKQLGNTSPASGEAYGMTFKNIKFTTSSNRFELYSPDDTSNYGDGSSITITSDIPAVLTVTPGNKDMKVTANGSSTIYAFGQLATVNLESGVTYTIESGVAVGSGKGRVYLPDVTLTKAEEKTGAQIQKGTADAANGAAIVKDGDKYYAVVLVSSGKAEESASLAINEDKKVTDTVYTSVKLGETTYEDLSVLGGGDYLYAVELTGEQLASKSLTEIQNAVTVTYSPVAE